MIKAELGLGITSEEATAGRVIAIGDIHGCADALEALISDIRPTPEDLLITLGDVVDCGPDSRRVVELLLDLAGRCRLEPVLGNHEEMLLAAVCENKSPERWFRFGGGATLDSYGFLGSFDVLPKDHVDFLQSFADYRETADHFFVHGNYLPELSLSEQPRRALRWTSLRQSTPAIHSSGKKAILGHSADPQGEILDLGHLTCLDTFCYGGFWLTAMDVESGTVWQANQRRETRSESLPAASCRRALSGKFPSSESDQATSLRSAGRTAASGKASLG